MAVAQDPSVDSRYFLPDVHSGDYELLSYEEEELCEDFSMYLCNEAEVARLYRGMRAENQRNDQQSNYTAKVKKPSKDTGVQTNGQVEGLVPSWILDMEDKATVLCTELSNLINMLFHDPLTTRSKGRNGEHPNPRSKSAHSKAKIDKEDLDFEKKLDAMTFWNYNDGVWTSKLHPDIKIPAQNKNSTHKDIIFAPYAFKQKLKYLLRMATRIKNSIPVIDIISCAEKPPPETKSSAKSSDGQDSTQEIASQEITHSSNAVPSTSVVTCSEETKSSEKATTCDTSRPEASPYKREECFEGHSSTDNNTLVRSSVDVCDKSKSFSMIPAGEASKSTSPSRENSPLTTMQPIVVSKCLLHPQKDVNSNEKQPNNDVVGFKEVPTSVGNQNNPQRKKQNLVSQGICAPSHKAPQTHLGARAMDRTSSRILSRTVASDARHIINEAKSSTGARRKIISSAHCSDVATSTSCVKKSINPNSKTIGSSSASLSARNATALDKKPTARLKKSENSAGEAKANVCDRPKKAMAQARCSAGVSYKMPPAVQRIPNNEKAKKAAHTGNSKISQVSNAASKTAGVKQNEKKTAKSASENYPEKQLTKPKEPVGDFSDSRSETTKEYLL